MSREKPPNKEEQAGKGRIIKFPDNPKERKLTLTGPRQAKAPGGPPGKGYISRFTGYAAFPQGCQICGCQQLAVYQLRNPDQGEAAKIYQIRLCAQCGLQEEYFAVPEVLHYTGNLVVTELERVMRVLQEYHLITQPQQWEALKVDRLQGAILLANRTFRPFKS